MTQVRGEIPGLLGVWGHRWKKERLKFQASLFDAERSRSLVGLVVGAFVYPLFGFLDVAIYPQYLPPLLGIRLMAVAVLVAMAYRVWSARDYYQVVKYTSIGYVLPACGVAAMCHLTEGATSPYYAGIPLSTVFLAAFLTWPVSVTVGSCAVVGAAYALPFVWKAQLVDSRDLALHGSFLVGTMVLVALGMRLRLLLAWELFSNREELAQRNRDLAELHELKDRTFQNVSHELRTPLTLMLVQLQRRLTSSSTSQSSLSDRGWVDELHRNGMRLFKQISDLLDLARADAQELKVAPEEVEVHSLLSSLIEELRSSMEAAGVSIELQLPRNDCVFQLDPARLEQVLLNLLGNAVKFTPSGGSILVTVDEDPEDGLRLSVRDTGSGIPKDQQARIFKRFQQADGGSTKRFGGSGIGLALVSELVDLMGGRVDVASEEGVGSTFTVTFPPSLAVDSGRAKSIPPPSRVTEDLARRADREVIGDRIHGGERFVAGSRGPRVVVAEDEEPLRRHLVEILGAHHRVIGVAAGDEALQEALLFRPHVVVSDVMMPGMDGVELCRKLGERAELRETAVVLLTARGNIEDRIEGRRVGADSYLTKPFDIRELLATIEGLLRSRMHLVGEYLAVRQLGSGGQSEVWLAEHRSTGQRVALKIIRSRGFESERARQRLRREHEALTRLEHPNIVAIVARGEQARSFFLAMEYLEGSTLDQLVRSGVLLPAGTIAAVGRRVAGALSHVHASGLIHRDVKCSNVMMLDGDSRVEARVRLIDFGTTVSQRGARAREGRVVGSLPYLAPELLENASEATVASDVYGLGVVLYRLCTGLVPYEGGTVQEILGRMHCDVARSPLAVAPRVPEALSRVIAQTIALDPADRWPSAAALEEALADLAEESAGPFLISQDVPTGATATVNDHAPPTTTTTSL